MRIKSYFAPSVQAAISLARRDFGDGVTLVTSHVASLDNRHLGEYEVVFAIEESVDSQAAETPQPKAPPPPLASAAAPAPAFNEMLRQAIVAPPSTHRDLPGTLEQIHSSLVALGLEPPLVRAFMTILQAAIPATPAPAVDLPEHAAPVKAVNPARAVKIDAPVTLPPVALWPVQTPAEQPAASQPPPQVTPPEAPKPRPFLSLFEVAPQPRPQAPSFSDAERTFMSSISSPKEQGV